uniref:Zinc-finger domain-containing protein n=1 Tax=Kalanchoe fedtschenkoi TaxID=63787 RepID=A0A7N0U1G3_KALFE
MASSGDSLAQRSKKEASVSKTAPDETSVAPHDDNQYDHQMVLGGAPEIEPAASSSPSSEPVFKHCHHCRLRRKDTFQCMASPKNCELKYCWSCLKNHYPNEMQPVTVDDWKCPKCQNKCNCSRCRIKRGEKPLGRNKRQHGDATMSDVMKMDINEVQFHASASTSTIRQQTPVNNGKNANTFRVIIFMQRGNRKNPKPIKCASEANNNYAEVQLPQGSPIDTVASIAMPASDVGHAFQFLKFCESFGQVFNLTEDDPHKLLNCLFFYKRQKDNEPLIIKFQKKLISFVPKDGRKRPLTCWLKDLDRTICKSKYPILNLQLRRSDMTEEEYDELEPSSKLRVLNFLSDEVLEEKSRVNVIRLEPSYATDSGNKFWNFGRSSSYLRVYMQGLLSVHDASGWIKFDLDQQNLWENYIFSTKNKNR